jgi:ABC-type Fe3+ transport system permease subunit
VVTIFVLALQSSGDSWSHLVANVLPGAVRRTLALMAWVGVLTLLIGTGTAWLVIMYRFPGRSVFQWLLLLPLAIPTYIISYAVAGTVLAIGLLIPLARLDNGVDAAMRSLFDLPTGLLLSGSAFAVVLAYTIRFLASSLGAVEASLSKISPIPMPRRGPSVSRSAKPCGGCICRCCARRSAPAPSSFSWTR